MDELGGLDRAVELIKQKAKIPQGEKVALVPYPPKRSLFDLIMSRSSENAAEAKLRALLNGWQTRIWLKGGYLRHDAVFDFGALIDRDVGATQAARPGDWRSLRSGCRR